VGAGHTYTGGDGKAVLLTGATGFVGMEVLARFLERTDRDVYVLVRGANDVEAARRVEGALSTLYGCERSYIRRVRAVRGDITREGLDLPERHREELAERVGEIVHVAASVEFDLALEQAREVNVEGTRRVLEFAELCERRAGLRRLSYVSTAYVAGEHAGLFAEHDLDVGQRFRNAYEQSKFEAERLVAGRRGRLPITVLRPSIIVGESDTGWTASFNVLYWPLRAFARGTYLAVPARREAPVDVVPVDFVADAIFLLSQLHDAEGKTYHLSAGPATSSVGELVELARTRFDRPAPRLIAPWAYRRVLHPVLVRTSRDARRRRALERSRLFFPYFAVNVAYDNRRCRETLAPAGIHPKPLRDYFDRLVEFALFAQWGRRPVSRAEVARVSSRRLLRQAQGSERLAPVGMHLDADDQAVAQGELVRH
jgi:thioester reductase-like protein